MPAFDQPLEAPAEAGEMLEVEAAQPLDDLVVGHGWLGSCGFAFEADLPYRGLGLRHLVGARHRCERMVGHHPGAGDIGLAQQAAAQRRQQRQTCRISDGRSRRLIVRDRSAISPP